MWLLTVVLVALLAWTQTCDASKNLAEASESFVNTDAHTKYAAWSIADTLNGTLALGIGKASSEF